MSFDSASRHPLVLHQDDPPHPIAERYLRVYGRCLAGGDPNIFTINDLGLIYCEMAHVASGRSMASLSGNQKPDQVCRRPPIALTLRG